MGRSKRNEDPAVIYHAGSRGNNRGRIVWDDDDYSSLTYELDRAATKYDWEVFAWCAMPNHHHVVVRARQGGLSAGFQQINGIHARRMHARYGRVGHLFQNRFFSRVVATPAYLVGSVLYVVRNPVEAGLCSTAGAWPYSSYRATVGTARAPRWLAVDRVLDLFGAERKEARAQFARSVHLGHLSVSDTGEGELPVDRWPFEPSAMEDVA